MIPGSTIPRHLEPAGWQRALQECMRTPEDLLATLGLPVDGLAAVRDASARFALKVPRSYVARMRPGDRDDPLLRQVLPVRAELLETPGFMADPVGDLQAFAGPGLLHKYDGRALLVTTGACAVHCRYCF